MSSTFDRLAAVPTGIWLAAAYVLGRDVPVGGPYPHICHADVVGLVTRTRFRVPRIACAACQAANPAGAARA